MKVKLVMMMPLKLKRVVACIEYTMKDKRKKSQEVPVPTHTTNLYIHNMIDIPSLCLGEKLHFLALSIFSIFYLMLPPSLIFNNIRFCRCYLLFPPIFSFSAKTTRMSEKIGKQGGSSESKLF